MADKITKTLLNDCLLEVSQKVQQMAPKNIETGYADLQAYIGTQHPVLGLSATVQRDLCKTGYSFSSLGADDQLLIWDYIWNHAQSHDAMSQALLMVEKSIKKLNAASAWDITRQWVSRTDNWAHSDSLSKFFCFWLIKNESLIFPQLEKWNKSKNAWERRQSLVSIVRITPAKGKVPAWKKIVPLIENLLDDEDYFVQKGIGWTLRDLSLVYPQECYDFLLKYYQRISGTAFTAAAEKLDASQKEKLKELRKVARKNNK